MTIRLSDKKVTVIGAGRSGQAAAKFLYSQKARVKISDQGPGDNLADDFKKWIKDHNVLTEFNGHTENFIKDNDLIVLSPGVKTNSPAVQWAEENKIPVIGEIELAWPFCQVPIIAVTGSNGKTTVVTLIKEVLEHAGKKVCLCGNIGAAFSEHVLRSRDYDYVVLEMSSFQLETTASFKPFISVFLNFSQNHLDHHQDMHDYFEAKKKIFANQDIRDYAVLNGSDPKIKDLAKDIKANVTFFDSTESLGRSNGNAVNPNYKAVCVVAQILGIDDQVCEETFRNFKGVEHRLEWVRNIEGIDFVNDSKSTTTEAGRWAIENIDRPIVMICGGRDKNIDFNVLNGLIKKRVKTVVVFGESKGKIKKAYEKIVKVIECDGLEDAVKEAKNCSSSGDCVVLSPMCTSFDSYANFEERGKVFKEIVGHLN